jgi:AcrR family transcriptional regulator
MGRSGDPGPAVAPAKAGAGAASSRKDARRNRDLLVEAATVAVARHGVKVGSEEIAERAGVGIATLYRHFPNRELLLTAVYERSLDVSTEFIAEALAFEDPWEGLVHFYERFGRWAEATPIVPELVRAMARTRAPQSHSYFQRWKELIARAHGAGVIRADATYADVGFITFSVPLVLGETETRMPGFWRRHLQLCLDGLRAPSGALPELNISGTLDEALDRRRPLAP